MKSLARLTQWLGIRTGEHTRFLALFAHSLFNGICVAFLFAGAYALFLDRYEAEDLPWAYIASAVAGYLVVAVFSRLERALSFRRLVLYQLYFVLLFVLTFWAATRVISAPWPVFLMFSALAPLLTLLELEYWGIAVRLFDLRQGKRLFTLISAGGVVSSIVGFFLVPVMIRTGAVRQLEDLLLFAAVGVVLSIVAVREIGRGYSNELEIRGATDGERRAGSLGALLRDRYFVLMAVLTVVFILALFLVDLSFLSELENQYPVGAELAAFVGKFYGLIKLLDLAFRLFAGAAVSRFGLRFGLTCLPALLAGVGLLAVLAKRFGTGAETFFLIVASIKLLWLVLRKAIFDGAFKVLYQPLQGQEKFAFQARLEGTVGPAVTLAVGGALLLYSREGFAALQLIYLLLPLLLVWLGVAALLYREYRNRLLAALAREVERGGSETPVDVIRQRLFEVSPEQLDYVAGVLEKVDTTAVPPAMVELVQQGPPELVAPVLRRIDRRRDVDSLEAVELCMAAEDAEVRAAAAVTMDNLRRIVDFAGGAGEIERLVRSADPADRELAALALGWSAGDSPGDLTGLLWDREPAVRRAALLAAGRLSDPRFWPRIVSHLDSSRYAGAATAALIHIGDPVLPELETAFNTVGRETDVRLRILNVYEHAGGERALEFIGDQLLFPDDAIRRRALASLSHSGYRLDPGEVPAVKNQIEERVATIAWNLAAILDLGQQPETLEVRAALESENLRSREEILLLLSLLFDSRAIGLVRRNLEGGDRESVVYALEILDVVVSADIKPLLFPVMENLPTVQAVRLLESFYPRQRMERLDRLGAITFREHDAMSVWGRACALDAIADLSAERVDDVLVANLFHPEPMLQQVAAASILRVDRGAYDRHVTKLSPAARERIERVLMPGDPDAESWQHRSTFGRVAALREARGFATLPWQALMALAREAEEIETETGQTFPPADEPLGGLYAVVEGRLGTYSETGGMGVLGPGVLFAFVEAAPSCRVLEAGHVLRLGGDRLYELAVAHVELASALLDAASPRVVEEVLSLSRSFETAISFAPSH